MRRLRTPGRGPWLGPWAARPGARALALAGVHLLVLSTFALAEPLFEVLANAPEFFVVRGSTRWDVVAFALGVTIVPALSLLAAEALVRLAGVIPWATLHLVFVAGLASVIALHALKRVTDGPAVPMIAGASAIGLVAAFAYARFGAIRSTLTVLAPAPLLFAALFLLNSPVSKITLGTESATAAPADVPGRAPIVMIVLDEISTTSLQDEEGRIDSVRYPNIASLARDSTWFPNATTVHEHTTEAVPAILSGNYPEDGQLPFVSDHPENLFTFLGKGYRLNVFEAATRLCPTDLCPRNRSSFASRMKWLNSDLSIVYLHVVLPNDLSRRLPPVSQTWMNFGGGGPGVGEGRRRFEHDIDVLVGHELEQDDVALFEGFADSIKPSRKPALNFLDVMLPHSPWQYLPSGAQYPNGVAIDGLKVDTWRNDEWLVTQAYQRHLLQTSYTDRLIGRVLARLRTTGLYDRSLVVLTADHGVSFRPGERRRGATPTNLHDIAFVPLFVKAPQQRRARVVDEHVQTIDLLPAIADLLDVRLPWETDGRSFFDPAYEPEAKIRVFRRAGEAAVVMDFGRLVEQKQAALRKKVALFGSRGGEPGLFGVGPYADDLLGRRADELAGASAGGMRAALDDHDAFGAVDLSSGVVPARITGRVEGEATESPLALAVAVNGTIEAVTQTFELDGSTRFSALVPEAAFRNGRNEVEVFSALEDGDVIRLASLGGA